MLRVRFLLEGSSSCLGDAYARRGIVQNKQEAKKLLLRAHSNVTAGTIILLAVDSVLRAAITLQALRWDLLVHVLLSTRARDHNRLSAMTSPVQQD